jgi:DNA-binding winged helix-turn-helix (wHTH) protein
VVDVTPLPRCTQAVRTRDLLALKIERQQTWANSGLPSIAAPLASPVDDLVAGADVRVIDVIAFHDVELHVALFELRRGGVKIRMEPQAFDVLTHLINNRERVVPKEELMDAVWGGRFISEMAVTTRIKQARRAVGDDGQAQKVIQTVHGRGYRFIAEVARASVAA